MNAHLATYVYNAFEIGVMRVSLENIQISDIRNPFSASALLPYYYVFVVIASHSLNRYVKSIIVIHSYTQPLTLLDLTDKSNNYNGEPWY